MGVLSFGQYLVDNSFIKKEDHEKALAIQNKSRLLGDLGIELHWLTEDDISSLLAYQKKHTGVRFGEAAVSLGVLTSNQLKYLLDFRTRRKEGIGDILVKNGFITQGALNDAVMNFDQKRKKLENILVVDTSRTIALIIKSMLSKYGYSVFHAKSGTEAMRLSIEIKPDILITSGVLDDMDGYELCSKILSSEENVSMNMVMLSGDNRIEDVDKAFEAGINHYLKKPVKEKELINMIYQIEREKVEKRAEVILVVDDSKGSQMIICKELLSNGFKVLVAENGKKALDVAKELKPNIITMDVEMPEMNGFETCQKLKEDPSTREIPVIMVSSDASPQKREYGFEVGAVEFFEKPFGHGRLADYIHMLLETKNISRSEKILIAEDSLTTRHILKYIFKKNGYKTIEAKDGNDASRLIREFKPDLIVVDCHMSGKDGFELTKEVKRTKEFRNIPVIILVAANKREDVLKGLTVGANDYLYKPFDEDELISRIKVHLVNKVLYDQIEQERNKYEQMYSEQSKILREISILNKMGNKLQACHCIDDTYSVIADSMQVLFPSYMGSLVLYNDDTKDYGVVTSWGGGGIEVVRDFSFTDCDSLQKKGKFICDKKSDEGRCFHKEGNGPGNHYCFSISEKEDTLGLIHFYQKAKKSESIDDIKSGGKLYLMNTAAKYVSLSLTSIKLQETLLEQSIKDPLTGLFNRRYMEESLSREILRAQRKNSEMGILMLDVDHFKHFNDAFGHIAGDCLLKGLGVLLMKEFRADDIVCRYGGEEFLVALPGLGRKLTEERAEKIRYEVENNLELDLSMKSSKVTISIGISNFPLNGGDLTMLVDSADKALYRAKDNGRNQVVVAA